MTDEAAPPAPADPWQQALTAARDSLACYQRLLDPGYRAAPVHRAIAWHLEAVLTGRIKRLWISCPPRHGKSTLVRAAACAFLGDHPDRAVYMMTHGAELARDHGMLARDILRSHVHREVWPGCRILYRGRAQEADGGEGGTMTRIDLVGGGMLRADSMRGAWTGLDKSAGLLVIDDPVKGLEAADSEAETRKSLLTYASVARTRMSPDAGIVGIDTSWGGKTLGAQLRAQPGWHVLRLRAIREDDEPCCRHGDWRQPGEALWPEMWPEERLRALARELEPLVGPRVWLTLFQQHDTAATGEMMHVEWMASTYDAVLPLERGIIYWDLTSGGKPSRSWNVGAAWGFAAGRFYVLDVMRFRGEAPEMLDRMTAMSAKWPALTPVVEPKAAGAFVVRMLRGKVPGLQEDDKMPPGDKTARFQAVLPLWRDGLVLLPRAAPWLDEFRSEHLSFPHGSADDQVDATSGGLAYLSRAQRAAAPIVAPVSGRRWAADALA